MTSQFVLVVFAFAFAISSVHARSQDRDDPRSAIRELVLAIYSHDVDAYNRVTTEHALRSRLTAGGSANPDRLRRLKEDPGGLQIREMRPKLFHGRPIEGDSAPAGATALYTVSHGGGPMVVPMVKRQEGWKVDVRWWIAGMQMAASSVQPPPEQLAIRSLLAAMLDLSKERAARYLTDPKAIDVLFVAAPRQREPSGVLEALVGEMPLVEIDAGEFYVMPSARMVEGGSTETRKVLVGLYGPTEMPFVVMRVGDSWRVQAEPYFLLINQ